MNLKKVGSFIAQKRKEKGYTQEVLGEKLGITSNTLSKWERGVNAPDISLLKSISDELEISLEELLCGEENDEDDETTSASDRIVDGIKYYTNRAKKRYVKIFSYCIFFVIFAFSIIFLITNYNRFRIYGLKSKNSSYYIEGHIIFNQERNLIIINNIDIRDKNIGTDKEEKIKKLNVSLKSENKTIFSSEKIIEKENNGINTYLLNNSFFADENLKSKEEILEKNVDINKLNLYIEYTTIHNENKHIAIPLDVVKEYSNNKIIY